MDKMGCETNAINWFEIPVTEMDRAKKFYETIFDIQMQPMEMPGCLMSVFPSDSSKGLISGALVKMDMYEPSTKGVVLYFNANPDLQLVLDRVEKSGGKINMQKTLINPEIGYMAFISDTEGNTVALHSNE
jgi:predicted enzyme related to lactoylglutathione lyase